ncbi:unnamed protein product [Rotaria sordida]|uniref:Uncharacterized protein n=1 Tax=Rotaria sordida TaxID=392033 RepID=A0A814LAZ3_9BILA|nr:unnamed protein product [Rotaria sordida]
MALQPQEKYEDLFNLYADTSVETSQYSENTIKNSVTEVTFSQITDIVSDESTAPSSSNNNLLSDIEDFNDIDKSFSNASDIEYNIEKLLKNQEFNFIDLPCDETTKWLPTELDKIELDNIDKSIQDREMSVETQPPTNIRRRYRSDGKRQIEKSRTKPMAIKLPNLKNCTLNSNQSFWIELILITTQENPANKVFIHIDQIEYHANNVPECDHGYVRIPLTEIDIQMGIKQLARVSIIKEKLEAYTFELIPFNHLSIDNSVEIYENENINSFIKKAKLFRDTYKLTSSRIACQLLIKQNEIWHMTNIVCETDVMKEIEKSEKSNKRSKSSNIRDDDDDDDDYSVHCRSLPKKRKRSSPSKKILRVTRVKKSFKFLYSETIDMASQPPDFCEDETTNNFIDFDQILNPPHGFCNEYEILFFSGDIGTLNTPTLEIANPLIQWAQAEHVNDNNGCRELSSLPIHQELTVPSQNTNEEIECIPLDVQGNDNGIENNSHQQLDAYEEEQVLQSIVNDLQNIISNEGSNTMDAQAVVNTIYSYNNPIMRMHIQPVERHRFRYRSDGIRYLEQSRRNPMCIKLPILHECLIKANQSFWLELTIVTTKENPQRKRFIHQHEMINNEANVQQNGLGSFRVLLTDEDVRRRKKIFRHLSIIKTKLDDYIFQLIPFDPLIEDNHMEFYTLPNEEHMTKKQKAKCFDRVYHTDKYQIFCQLMIKQNDQWYMTPIYCKTHEITDI